jgi:hypothetical protein
MGAADEASSDEGVWQHVAAQFKGTTEFVACIPHNNLVLCCEIPL